MDLKQNKIMRVFKNIMMLGLTCLLAIWSCSKEESRPRLNKTKWVCTQEDWYVLDFVSRSEVKFYKCDRNYNYQYLSDVKKAKYRIEYSTSDQRYDVLFGNSGNRLYMGEYELLMGNIEGKTMTVIMVSHYSRKERVFKKIEL